MANDHGEQIRIVQETVAGKEITFAHVMGGPAPIIYQKLGLNIYEYSFDEHDRTVAYSLSIPFVSTFVFAAVMKHQDAPGTTFKRHMKIAQGVLNEDDYLLQEILFNPYTHDQVAQIRTELKELLEIIDNRDAVGMKAYLTKIRDNVRRDIEIKHS